MPVTWSTMIQAGLPAGNMQTFATLLDSFQFEEEIGNSPGRQGADRRRRRDHPVELPAPPGDLQGRRGARRRLHDRPQALRGGAVQRVHPRRDRPRGRSAERGVQPRDRHRARRRRGDRRPPGSRHGQLHRLDPRRQAGGRGGRRHGQARRPRARRQVGQHRARRRRLREGHSEGAVRLLPQLGPDVHRPHPHARPNSRYDEAVGIARRPPRRHRSTTRPRRACTSAR